MAKNCNCGEIHGFDQWNLESLGIMALGGLGAKALVNPLSKAIFKKSKPKYTPLLIKGGLSLGLSMIDNEKAQLAAQGAFLSTAFEAADILLPAIFNPTSNTAKPVQLDTEVSGYDDDDLLEYVSGDEEEEFIDTSVAELVL